MNYKIHIARPARKALARVAKSQQERIISAVRSLSENPRPQNACILKGREAWRIRVGNYRIIYEIDDNLNSILIITLGPRGKIYKKM